MNEPRKTRRYKRRMKRRKVADKIWTIIQKILMGDAGRIGTSGVCLKYLKDELPDSEKVLISFSFGILTTASDGVHFLQEMEDLEEATHRTGLGSVVSPSNASEYIKDLIASGFNPAVMWGVDGLLKIRNVDDLLEAGDDLKKLSDLVDPKDLEELEDREEEEDELDREYGVTPPGHAAPGEWYMEKDVWYDTPPEERLYFLEYMESTGKKTIILMDGEDQESYPVDVSLDVYRGWKRRKDTGIEGTQPSDWGSTEAPIMSSETESLRYDPEDPEGSDLVPGWLEGRSTLVIIPDSIRPLIDEVLRESSVPQIQEAFITGLTNLINDRNWKENVHQRMMDSDPE